MAKHMVESHPGLNPDEISRLFSMKVLRSFQRPMDRQIFEATTILRTQRGGKY